MRKLLFVFFLVSSACAHKPSDRLFEHQYSRINDFPGGGVGSFEYEVVSSRQIDKGDDGVLALDEVSTYLSEHKLRPATLDELRIFAALKEGDAVLESEVYALGSVKDNLAPYISRGFSGLYLTIGQVLDGFGEESCFLVVKVR